MIEGCIVRIVDERSIIANIGAEHGVTVGAEFVVIQSLDAVTDPESGDELGTLEAIKARVLAMHVQPKLTTFVPVGSEQIPQTVLSERLAWDSRGAPIGSTDESLPIDRSQMAGRRQIEAIRVGDVIRVVVR
jgi:hypothetical protein